MKTHYIYLAFFLFLCGSCLKEENIDTVVQVEIILPQEYDSADKSGINVTLYNTASGLSYKALTDANGTARLQTEYGLYDAIVQHQYTEGYNTYIFNGRLSHIVLSPEKDATENSFRIALTSALKSSLIIKEIYFGGCMTDDGITYNSDNYLSLYNNSGTTVWLDSLCLGFVAPMTSSSKSNFVKEDGSLMDLLPVAMMAWQIPGSGKDYPLNPGEEAIFAVNAIDHETRHPQSVDLSKARFAFYNINLSMQEPPAPGVTLLNQIWKGPGEAYGLVPNGGPAMILFRIPGDAVTYASDASHLQQDPVTHTGLYHLMIHKDWVLDGIECIKSKSSVNKRLTDNIDAGFVCQETLYSGLSVCRKIEKTTDGIVIYQDTNNSSEDMEIVPATLKNR